MTDQKLIGFALSGISTTQFAIFPENFDTKKEADIEIKVDFGLESETQEVVIQSSFIFTQKKRVVVKLEIACKYKIAPESWDDCSTKDKVSLPKEFVIHLVGLNVGVARGVFHAKTEGTIFNAHFLPTVDVISLIKEDVIFRLEQSS